MKIKQIKGQRTTKIGRNKSKENSSEEMKTRGNLRLCIEKKKNKTVQK